MPKLNMWQRLGIVITVIWMFGAGIQWLPTAIYCAVKGGWQCDLVGGNVNGSDAWFWALPHSLQFWHLGTFGTALYAIVIFPMLVWGAVWIAFKAVRWVLAGRAVSKN